MNRPILKLIFLISTFSPIALYASVESCAAITCDCSSIFDPNWQVQCQQQEKSLQQICVENRNKPRNYCGIHGPDANRVTLVTRYRKFEPMSQAEIKPSLKAVKTQLWSVENDMDSTSQASAKGDFKAAEVIRKGAEKTRSRIFKTRKRIAATWESLGEPDEAEDMWDSAASQLRKSARKMKVAVDELWSTYHELRGDGEEKRLLGNLIDRALKNLGNEFERAAYAFERAKEPDNAAVMWGDAAEISERLVFYKTQTSQKKAVVNYYRHQAATRWYRAALSWVADEEFDQASTVYHQAEALVNVKNK